MTVDGRRRRWSAVDDLPRAACCNHAKLAYNGVAAWLDGDGAARRRRSRRSKASTTQLRLQDRVAQALRGERQARGALSLETIEARPVFDGDELVDLRPDEKQPRQGADRGLHDRRQRRHRALSRGARAFRRSAAWCARRSAGTASSSWPRELGERLPPDAERRALDDVPRRGAADRSRALPRSLALGRQAARLAASTRWSGPGSESAGHFGLAVSDYTHSTAPNRRFPDLITQRLLKAALAGRAAPYSDDELDALAGHCTQQEDDADKVERQVRKSAAALLLASRIGERFDGIVTGASEKGTWVRIFAPARRGQGRARLRGARRRRPRARRARPHRRRARLHRLRAGEGEAMSAIDPGCSPRACKKTK